MLALAADLRVCDDSSSLILPFMRLGIIPDRFTLCRLLALVGPATTRRLIFGAEWATAEECLRLGLVDRVVPRGTLTQAILEMTLPYKKMAMSSLAIVKERLLHAEMGNTATLAEDLETMVRSLCQGDVAERAQTLLPK